MTRTSTTEVPEMRGLGLREDPVSAYWSGRARYAYVGRGFSVRALPYLREPVRTQTSWAEEHEFLFPSGAVAISVMSERPFLAGPNHAVLFNPGDQFKRQVVLGGSDRSLALRVGVERLRERAGEGVLTDGRGVRFVHRLVPLPPRSHLVRWALFRYLNSEAEPNPSLVESACCFIVDGVLAAAREVGGRTPQHEAVEEAKGLMMRSLAEPLTLDRIAKELFVSAFHLARLFKAETGYTLHGYLTQLRLRRALDLLADSQLDVNEIRAQVGFTTHSHFTESFRRAFGVTPSLLRSVSAERLRSLIVA